MRVFLFFFPELWVNSLEKNKTKTPIQMVSWRARPIDEEAAAETGFIWDKKQRVDGDGRQVRHRQTTSPSFEKRGKNNSRESFWQELGRRLGVKGRRPLQQSVH